MISATSHFASFPNKLLFLLLLHLYLPILTEATTEWFGDLRAHLNPPDSPPFYDVTYDDSDCSMGLQSNAIPEFVYFGEMLATKSVKEHSTCLQMCVQNARCKAVNFFEPLTKKEKGFCELLSESQFDNPRLMRPFKKAIYYEKIRCRALEDEYSTGEQRSSRARSETSTPLIQVEDNQSASSPLLDHRHTVASNLQDPQDTSSTENRKEFTPRPKLFKKSELSMLKKLAAKVHEFNLRFGSR